MHNPSRLRVDDGSVFFFSGKVVHTCINYVVAYEARRRAWEEEFDVRTARFLEAGATTTASERDYREQRSTTCM